jgi:integrase
MNMKLNKRIDQFKMLKKAETRDATMRYYEAKISIIQRYLGTVDDKSIDEFVIADFTNKQKERNPNISPRTLNYYREIIVRIIKDTTGRKIKIKKLKVDKPFIKSVEENNINKIIDYYRNNINQYNNHKYLLIISLLLDTGVRIKELINIEIKNININYRAIQLDHT